MAKIRDEDLNEVARIYNTAFEIGQGHRATQIVAQAFGVERGTAIRHLDKARAAGLVNTFDNHGHRPLRVRFTDGGPSWTACAECRHPWPCPDSSTPTTDKDS